MTDEVQLDGCTGCRACEVACSFHWTKSFSPAHSCIQVSRNNSTGLMSLALYARCDLCEDEKEPLCIRFCAPNALDLSLLRKLKGAIKK